MSWGADAPALLCHLVQLEQGRRKQLRSRRARNALCRTNAVYWSRASVLVSLGPQAWSTQSQRVWSCRDTCPQCCPRLVPAPLGLQVGLTPLL